MNCNYDRVVYRMKVRQRISSECSSKMELVELTLKDVKGVRMNVTGFGLLNWIAGKTVSNLIQETVLQVTLNWTLFKVFKLIISGPGGPADKGHWSGSGEHCLLLPAQGESLLQSLPCRDHHLPIEITVSPADCQWRLQGLYRDHRLILLLVNFL